MNLTDRYSYSDLRALVEGKKTLTVGELRTLTKELLQFVLKRRERAERSDKRAEFVVEDDTLVDLEEPELDEEAIDELEVTL